ncbi:hypothetical protein CYY_010123 [Polysphondylium violaceum]|uniref:Transmembrane protein n=1 Tax=Polysphondylium violaceum TaxID=133409 RepID=A0A8J4UNZ5_9MYCE|nr:hypothetical protein CYY_010123 [Polysphondylium violaceum]
MISVDKDGSQLSFLNFKIYKINTTHGSFRNVTGFDTSFLWGLHNYMTEQEYIYAVEKFNKHFRSRSHWHVLIFMFFFLMIGSMLAVFMSLSRRFLFLLVPMGLVAIGLLIFAIIVKKRSDNTFDLTTRTVFQELDEMYKFRQISFLFDYKVPTLQIQVPLKPIVLSNVSQVPIYSFTSTPPQFEPPVLYQQLSPSTSENQPLLSNNNNQQNLKYPISLAPSYNNA